MCALALVRAKLRQVGPKPEFLEKNALRYTEKSSEHIFTFQLIFLDFVVLNHSLLTV